MSSGKRPVAPRVCQEFDVRDLVEGLTDEAKRIAAAIRRVGREAAHMFGEPAQDGEQEAWAVAVEAWPRLWRAGYPPLEIVQCIRGTLMGERSPLRCRAHDVSTRSRDAGAIGVPRRGYGVPITNLDRLLARMTASTLGPSLERLSVHAALRCPECGRAGHWEAAAPPGTRQAKRRARAWQLAAEADAGQLEAGTPTGGGPRVEELHAAAGLAGTEPVWACGHPWGLRRHWTRTPIALLREGGDPSRGMHPGGPNGDTGRVERDLVALMDVLAEERRRMPVFALLERPRGLPGRRRTVRGWAPMRGPSWTTIHADQKAEARPSARPDARPV